MTVLLDGNVLVGLAVTNHVFHVAAEDWIQRHEGRVASCPITQGTLLRVLVRITAEGWPPSTKASPSFTPTSPNWCPPREARHGASRLEDGCAHVTGLSHWSSASRRYGHSVTGSEAGHSSACPSCSRAAWASRMRWSSTAI